MIMIVGLGGRGMRRSVGGVGMGCIAGIRDISAKLITLPSLHSFLFRNTF